MKSIAKKKIFSFIIAVMMFSVSVLNAQNPACNCPCNGNKVRMHYCSGPFCLPCESKCVPLNQVQNYVNQGWQGGGCPVYMINQGKAGKQRLTTQDDNDANAEIYPNIVSSSSTNVFLIESKENVTTWIFNLSEWLMKPLTYKFSEAKKLVVVK